MRREHVAALLLCVAAIFCQACADWDNPEPLPAPSATETWVIAPGAYYMDAHINLTASNISVITAVCGAIAPPCVTLDMGEFSLLLDSHATTQTLEINYIAFANYTAEGTAAINIQRRLNSLQLKNVRFETSSANFVSAIAPDVVKMTDVTIRDNTSPIIFDFYSDPASMTFIGATSLTVTKMDASRNLATGEESIFVYRIDTINEVIFEDSYFSVNPNILRIGESSIGNAPGIVSNGIELLSVKGCTFEDHSAFPIGPNDGPDGTVGSNVVPLFWQTTKSSQTSSSAPWIFSGNTFSRNNATLLKAQLIDYITFENNHFTDSPQSVLFEGQTTKDAIFRNNVYSRSGRYSMITGQVLDVGALPTATFIDETLDFDLYSDELELGNSIQGSQSPIVILGVTTATFKNVSFSNVRPAFVTIESSIVAMDSVETISFEDCSFNAVSLTNAGDFIPSSTPSSTPSSPVPPPSSATSLNIAPAAISRISVTWEAGSSSTPVHMTLKNNNFGSFHASDSSTADIGAFDNSGAPSGQSLTLQGYGTSGPSSPLEINRIASTSTINIQDDLIVKESIYNPLNAGLGKVIVAEPMVIDRKVSLYGRVELEIGAPKITFLLSKTSTNGSISGVLAPNSDFVPRMTLSPSTRFAVDLSSDLAVPLGSVYPLATYVFTALPSVTNVEPLKDGSAQSGFTGRLSLSAPRNATSSGNPSTYYTLSMTATPLCTVQCITGVCLGRDYCDCEDGWTGAACTCLESGRPAGASCSNSTTDVEWIASTQQNVNGTLTLPEGLVYIVRGNMSVSGALTLSEGSQLVVYGQLDVTGSISMRSLAGAYTYSCDLYLPNMIAAQGLSSASSSRFSVAINTKNIPKCGSAISNDKKKRDAGDDIVLSNYDYIIVVNGSTELGGSIVLDATGVEVPPGRQQQAKLIAVDASANNASNVQLTGLSVQPKTTKEVCSRTETKQTLVSVFFTACNGKKQSVKWWWYGIPIICVVAVAALILILTLAVPPWRRAVFPYSAKAKT